MKEKIQDLNEVLNIAIADNIANFKRALDNENSLEAMRYKTVANAYRIVSERLEAILKD